MYFVSINTLNTAEYICGHQLTAAGFQLCIGNKLAMKRCSDSDLAKKCTHFILKGIIADWDCADFGLKSLRHPSVSSYKKKKCPSRQGGNVKTSLVLRATRTPVVIFETLYVEKLWLVLCAPLTGHTHGLLLTIYIKILSMDISSQTVKC